MVFRLRPDSVVSLSVSARVPFRGSCTETAPLPAAASGPRQCQLHPEVDPQVLHFMQVPLRTRVKLPHSPQGSPS